MPRTGGRGGKGGGPGGGGGDTSQLAPDQPGAQTQSHALWLCAYAPGTLPGWAQLGGFIGTALASSAVSAAMVASRSETLDWQELSAAASPLTVGAGGRGLGAGGLGGLGEGGGGHGGLGEAGGGFGGFTPAAEALPLRATSQTRVTRLASEGAILQRSRLWGSPPE